MNKVDLKNMLEEQKLSTQLAVKLSKSERDKVHDLSDHYGVSMGKIVRTAIGIMHDLMLEEKNNSNNQKPKK